MEKSYDIIVIGGGHAGCEAAMSAANLGRSVLLISMDMLGFAKMSCNPAIGGIAKGQIVKEIDALGGYTGIVTDATTLQFRMLNKSKGPAMWSPRAQCDKIQFSLTWREFKNLRSSDKYRGNFQVSGTYSDCRDLPGRKDFYRTQCFCRGPYRRETFDRSDGTTCRKGSQYRKDENGNSSENRYFIRRCFPSRRPVRR